MINVFGGFHIIQLYSKGVLTNPSQASSDDIPIQIAALKFVLIVWRMGFELR